MRRSVSSFTAAASSAFGSIVTTFLHRQPLASATTGAALRVDGGVVKHARSRYRGQALQNIARSLFIFVSYLAAQTATARA